MAVARALAPAVSRLIATLFVYFEITGTPNQLKAVDYQKTNSIMASFGLREGNVRLLDQLHRNTRRSRSLLNQLSLAGLLLSQGLFSQAPSGQITGKVIDPAGAEIAGAMVIITNTATNLRRAATTNGSGIYDAPALPPGNYSVRVEMKGFKSDVRNNIDLQVEQVANLNFTLEIGDVKETVEVSAQAATLDTENAAVGTVVETRRIETTICSTELKTPIRITGLT